MADGDIIVEPSATRRAPLFNAAGTGRRLRMYRPSNAGPNAVTQQGAQLVLQRARAAARNDPWAGASLDKLVSNEIGTGIQAKTVNGSATFKAAAKKLWDRWVKVADADGVFDLYGLQSLIDREAREAGECFVRLRQRRLSDGLPVPLQLQVIEAEQCPLEYYGAASNGNTIRAGIEFNQIGQRVAYWMWPQHPGDQIMNMAQPMVLSRVPAEQILHVYSPARAGQIRGLPLMTSTLVRMFNLDNLDDAVLERQKIANLFAVYFVTDANAPDEGFLAETEASTPQTGDPIDGPIAGLEPGLGAELPPGMKPEFSTPPDAGTNYPSYLKTQLMAIAARVGIPYEVLTGDLAGISDRALRLILNEFRRAIEQWQWLVLIPMLLQRVRDAWWDAAVLAGAIDVPDYAGTRDDVVETLWVPQGYPYSHPVQDVTADEAAIRCGLKSRQGVILGNGDDPDQVTREIIEDNKVADDNDLIFDSDPRYTSVKGITQAKPAGSVEPATDPANDPNNETEQLPPPPPARTPPENA